jgi:hypothetical protein
VIYVLLSLTPLSPSRKKVLARLACLIHAANVHSEPGSNPSIVVRLIGATPTATEEPPADGRRHPELLATFDAGLMTFARTTPNPPDCSGRYSPPDCSGRQNAVPRQFTVSCWPKKFSWDHYQIVKEQKPLGDPGRTRAHQGSVILSAHRPLSSSQARIFIRLQVFARAGLIDQDVDAKWGDLECLPFRTMPCQSTSERLVCRTRRTRRAVAPCASHYPSNGSCTCYQVGGVKR